MTDDTEIVKGSPCVFADLECSPPGDRCIFALASCDGNPEGENPKGSSREAMTARCHEVADALDIPPERNRSDEHREDIARAWKLIDGSDHSLDSTEGHLAVLRGIRLGRSLALSSSKARVETLETALKAARLDFYEISNQAGDPYDDAVGTKDYALLKNIETFAVEFAEKVETALAAPRSKGETGDAA